MSGLYIHVPFCHAKCAYCDFYSIPASGDVSDYVNAVISEAALRGHELNSRITTLYIGGGTPSILNPAELDRLVAGIDKILSLSDVTEFTIEVNPEDVTRDYLLAIKKCGVTRVSMGVQSLIDSELKSVGRRHSALDALEAMSALSSCFDNFSLDVIFGLPGQTIQSLDYTLKQIVATGAPHLSAYLLSYEPGTRLYAQLLSGKTTEISDEVATEMYMMIDEYLSASGYVHYEISNYAKPGMESRHNSSYWDSTPYLGLGPSAHSFDGDTRRYNDSSLKGYMMALSQGHSCEVIDDETMANKFNDYLITRLRTRQGLDMEQLAAMPFGDLVNAIYDPLKRLSDSGDIVIEGSRVTIPHQRWLVSDAILRQLII